MQQDGRGPGRKAPQVAPTEPAPQAARTTEKGGVARQAILDATRELVALKGPHATTVRDICDRSRANVAAVRYYFGSKEDLVREAVMSITAAVNAERLARLTAAEAAAACAPVAPEAILRALIEPIRSCSRALDGGSLYLRMVYQMRIMPTDPLALSNFNRNDHVAQAFLRVMAHTFPGLDRRGLIWRYEFARGAALHLLSDVDPKVQRIRLLAGEAPLPEGRDDSKGPDDAEGLVPETIDLVIGLVMGGFTGA